VAYYINNIAINIHYYGSKLSIGLSIIFRQCFSFYISNLNLLIWITKNSYTQLKKLNTILFYNLYFIWLLFSNIHPVQRWLEVCDQSAYRSGIRDALSNIPRLLSLGYRLGPRGGRVTSRRACPQQSYRTPRNSFPCSRAARRPQAQQAHARGCDWNQGRPAHAHSRSQCSAPAQWWPDQSTYIHLKWFSIVCIK